MAKKIATTTDKSEKKVPANKVTGKGPLQGKQKAAGKTKAKVVTPRPPLSEEDIAKRQALKAYKHYNRVKSRYFSFMRQITRRAKDSSALFTAISNGKTELSGTVRREIKKFDEEFILEIERVIPALEKIVMSPHKFIAEIAEDVQVEKAKKITPRAVKYLSQNSQNVDKILDDGKVIPKRVLNVYVDDDIKIYENRFVMTLIKRLQVFIELRYKYIQDHGDSKDSDVVEIKKEVQIGDNLFSFEGKMKMITPSEDEGRRKANDDILERLTSLRRRSMFLVTSSFMNEMSRTTLVQEPIQQTNIIRMNYLYQDAYRLWKFINRYDELGIVYKVTQARVNFDNKYLNILNHLALTAFLALDTEHATLAPRDIKIHTVKPRITPGVLDFEISDDRFLEHGLPVKVRTKIETEAQKEARLKREAAKAKAKEKKALEKQKAKEKADEKRRIAKEKMAARKKAAAEKARLRQEKALERQKELEAEAKRRREEKEKLLREKRAYENMLKEEARKLRLARINVASRGQKERDNENSGEEKDE